MTQQDYEIFKLGDWELQSGEKILDAHLAYKTFGDPKSPAIVYPTWFSGGMSLESGSEMFYCWLILTCTRNHRQRMADRRRQDPQPQEVLHHRPGLIWERPVFIAFQSN